MTVEFVCNSYTLSKWRFNNNLSLPTNALTENRKNLKIFGITVNNAGHYECEGTNDYEEYFSAVGTLKVKGENKSIIKIA